MAGRKKKKQQIPIRRILIFLSLIVVLAVVFLLIGNGRIYKSSAKNRDEIEKTVESLKAMEAKAPVTAKPSQPVEIPDQQTEQEKAMAVAMEAYDVDMGKRWFQGCDIIGDSLMEAVVGYGFLGEDVVDAEIGVGLETSDHLFERAIGKQPGVIILCFGMNDMTAYEGNIDMFAAKYAERVDQLKAALPSSIIYINSVFPIQAGFEDTVPGCQYQAQYNEALKAYCEKTKDVYYLDSEFILIREPDLYDGDGIHPKASFYPKWLTYVADMAGLSKAEGDK